MQLTPNQHRKAKGRNDDCNYAALFISRKWKDGKERNEERGAEVVDYRSRQHCRNPCCFLSRTQMATAMGYGSRFSKFLRRVLPSTVSVSFFFFFFLTLSSTKYRIADFLCTYDDNKEAEKCAPARTIEVGILQNRLLLYRSSRRDTSGPWRSKDPVGEINAYKGNVYRFVRGLENEGGNVAFAIHLHNDQRKPY